jgi:GTP cyclohydrolase I
MSERRISRKHPADVEGMSEAISSFLRAAGFDAESEEHLRRSGQRVAEAWSEDLLEGYAIDPVAALGETFADDSRDMVLVKDIEFFSSCPHHLMPYRGRAHIAYVPAGLAVGFSGIVRLLDSIAHRLTLQEWLCRDVTATLMAALQPAGAACIIKASPMCVFARGVRRPCLITSTSFAGVFGTDPDLRRDLLHASTGEG